jgi:glyoxylase-like metal-dependent hydrolase (beta-lactamase superfamily II)
MKTIAATKLALPCALALVWAGASLRQDLSQVEIEIHPVAGAVSMLAGRGGNIGVSSGEDGILLIDDQFLPLAPKIEAALAELGGGAPRFLVNTHWHGDHTGGNAHFGEIATILAHANVRRRLAGDTSIGGRVQEETPAAALPVVTYEDGLSIHFNGEEIRVFHLPAAHTDGDSVVWFTGSGVVHVGDLYFQVGYPFIDLGSGGSVEGLIAGVKAVLARVPADARVIPGHGEVTGVDGLREYLAMIEEVAGRVRRALAEGQSEDEIVAAGLTKDFDARWGRFDFVPPERFVRTLVQDLGGD